MTMEEKQLDFNRPLLSVRRPISESETKPTNKIPASSPPVYKSDIKSGPVRNPGTVPFQWEHQPGQPKDPRREDLQCFLVPKLPPGRVKEAETRADSVMEDAKSSTSRCDDDDDTFVDAADALSRSASFFFNCSNVSGHVTLVEPFGTLLSDRQTQDLMMGRFLPAAKALTSETSSPSHHLSRKPPKPEVVVVREKQNKAVEDGDKGSMVASGVGGLVPQICLRSSFGVLNPVPSVRVQAQRGVSVRRMRSKYQDSCNEKNQNKNTESVIEDKSKLKVNGSVAQGGSLSLSSAPEAKEKVESSRTKVSKNFGELLASDDNTWKPSSESPVAEKTLYVDTVHSVNKMVQEDSKENPSLDVVVPVKKEVQNLIRPGEEAISQPKTTEQSVTRDECPDEDIVAPPESNVVAEVTKEKIDLEAKLQRNTKNLETSRLHHHHRSTYHIVPPPPLPKAPSDSWLKRTLPTVPSKNKSFTWLQSLGADDNNKINNQANPKWETMVKTSNTQQGFVCFSKESLNPIPEA